MSRRMRDRLVSTGAYRDVDPPVIVTSGEFLTPFYVNAEKLCGDPDVDRVLAACGQDDAELIRWACDRAERDPVFAATVEDVCRRVRPRLGPRGAVAGGQRRDWIFSGPVAKRLGRLHVSLYKQSPGQLSDRDRVVVRDPDGAQGDLGLLRGARVVPVADMLTAASSCYRQDAASGRDQGWVPMLRERGADVRDLVAVVSRRQGGEERLASFGVRAVPCVRVDAAFLSRVSRSPAHAVAAHRDPEAWTRSYLVSHGAALLVPYLAQDPKRLPRLRVFAARYRRVLEQAGLWTTLDREARTRLGRGMEELLGERG